MAEPIILPTPQSKLVTEDGNPTQALLELFQQIADEFHDDDTISFHGARVYQTAVTALTINGAVLLFGGETFDTSGLHSTSSNTGRLVADTDGYWVSTAQLATESEAKENEFLGLVIRRNGTTVIAQHGILFEPSVSFNGRAHIQVTSGEIFLSQGDYLEVLGQLVPDDNSRALEFATWFSMRRVGE